MKKRIRILYPNDSDWENEINRIGVDRCAISIFKKKKDKLLVLIKDLKVEAVNILKQDALSVGADLVAIRSAISGKPERSNAILIADERQLEKLEEKLRFQPFSLKTLVTEIRESLNKNVVKKLKIRDGEILLDSPKVMGILNVTPDSFYDGGRYLDLETIKKRIEKMLEEGVDIIDIGAESTRPGSQRVGLEEEKARLMPVVKLIKEISSDLPISVDTYKSETAQFMLENGAHIINDISGLTFDKNMANVVAKYKAGLILMHIKGTPENMQKNPYYDDVISELYNYFINQIDFAEKNGVSTDYIAIDPGIGFGKRLEDNTEIIRRLKEFSSLSLPILMGLSRKSFLGMLTGREVGDRLAGTIAAHTISLLNGADILRVHDVKEAKDAINVVKGVMGQ